MGGERSHPLAESSGGEPSTALHLETSLLIINKADSAAWGRRSKAGEKTTTKGNQEANHRVKRLQAPHCHFSMSLCRCGEASEFSSHTQRPRRRGSRVGKQPEWPAGLLEGEMWLRAACASSSRRQGDVCTCPCTAKDWKNRLAWSSSLLGISSRPVAPRAAPLECSWPGSS